MAKDPKKIVDDILSKERKMVKKVQGINSATDKIEQWPVHSNHKSPCGMCGEVDCKYCHPKNKEKKVRWKKW
jgi:hypothetical protein